MDSGLPRTEFLTFPCEGEQLAGVLHYAATAGSRIGIVIVVGGPQYRVGSHRQFVLLARALAAAGYPVLRFDVRGMGDSLGDPAGFDAIDADIKAAIDCLFSRIPNLSGVGIFGLCDAASAALMYCPKDSRVQALLLANPWVRTPTGQARTFVRHYYLERIRQRSFWTKLLNGELLAIDSARGFLGTLVTSLRHSNPDDRQGSPVPFLDRMLAAAQAIRTPALLIISENDHTAQEFLGLEQSSRQWGAAFSRDGIQRVCLHGADHTFSERTALETANDEMIRWLDQLAPRGSSRAR